MKTFRLDSSVKVKLSDEAKKIVKDYYEKDPTVKLCGGYTVSVDEYGYTDFQLDQFIKIFGPTFKENPTAFPCNPYIMISDEKVLDASYIIPDYQEQHQKTR